VESALSPLTKKEVSKRSGKRFRIGERASPVHFLVWFLNTLNKDMGGSRKRKSIVQECFEGEVLIKSEKQEKILKRPEDDEEEMHEGEEPEFEIRLLIPVTSVNLLG
jgi:U4/U6.U5 tri-snRNP-associated protein 2